MPFQPQVTQGFHTNYAPVMAQVGAQIGAGIQQYRRKQEEKKQEDLAVEFILGQGLVKDEKEARAAIKGVGLQNFMAFIGEQNEQQHRDRMFDLQKTKAIAEEFRAEEELNLKRRKFDFETNEDYELRKQQLEVNLTNAKTSEELAQIRRDQLDLEIARMEEMGEPVDLGGGAKAFFDGNSLKIIPGTESQTPADVALTLNKILDPDSALGVYYQRTRNKDGTLAKKWTRSPEVINPTFERTLAGLGLPSFGGADVPETPANQRSSPSRNSGSKVPQYMEGDTATHPATGEQMIFRNGQWENLN